MESEWTLSVGQLNEYVRKMLAGDPMLRDLRVSGELSGFKRHFSGHLYFTLKDETGRVQCVMFRSSAQSLAFEPQDGMRVTVRGAASLYPQTGSFQIYVSSMDRAGVGELYQRFERLKRSLAAEGLFDAALKRDLPPFPRTIGVVTSRTGAVLRDIVRVARRRDPRVRILLAPASVQGAGAAREIADALRLLNRQGEADVILCGRGGGSMEDLWPFNEEIVARAIRASRIPVVSCVGHETDFTIADFAADLRAPTPSAAAELAVPEADALLERLDSLLSRSGRALEGKLALQRARLDRLTSSAALKMPARTLIDSRRRDADNLTARLKAASARRSDGCRNELKMLERALEAVNPSAVLERGYAVIRRNKKAVSQADELMPGDLIDIAMRGGERSARVLDGNGDM